MKIPKEITIAIVFIIILALFIWGYNFLKGLDILKKDCSYYALYNSIEGLKQSSSIFLNGIEIGRVGKIDFSKNDYRRIIVELKIDKKYLIPVSSIAEIYSADIMGNRAIRIILSNEKEYYKEGDTLISQVEADLKEQVSAQVLPLKIKAENLIKSIDSMVVAVRSILDPNTRYNISTSIASLRKTLSSIEHSAVILDTLVASEKYALVRIISNIESISYNFQKNNDLINNIIANLSSITDTLRKANISSVIYNAQQSLARANNILEKIEKGKGTLGLLVHNEELYFQLEKSARDLDKLLKDIRENPKRYVHFSIFDFGKTVILDENTQNKKKYNKNIPDSTSYINVESDTTLVYRVQIRSSKKQIINEEEFKGIKDVKVFFHNNRYKYTVGKFYNKHDADSLRKNIIHLFPDAFVVKTKGENFYY
ncbi:MAG: MlaD family protein [Bacteroidales bacterium]|nr:MlaD family protein [Bacteroidales bacterium]